MNNLSKLSILLVTLMTAGLAGCNTVEGFGKDVEATGEAIDEAADDVRDEIND